MLTMDPTELVTNFAYKKSQAFVVLNLLTFPHSYTTNTTLLSFSLSCLLFLVQRWTPTI